VSPSGPPVEGGAPAAPASTVIPTPVAPTPVVPAPVARAAPKDDAGGALRGVLARAREQRERGRCEAALDLYGQALAIDGRNATALAGRGACYLDLSRYAQAEASFEGALDSDPRNAEALFGLAETYRYMGRKAEAVAGYEKFLAVRPTGDDAAAARRLISQLKE
jgi:tetratricopeptide (TPR) repeat protein